MPSYYTLCIECMYACCSHDEQCKTSWVFTLNSRKSKITATSILLYLTCHPAWSGTLTFVPSGQPGRTPSTCPLHQFLRNLSCLCCCRLFLLASCSSTLHKYTTHSLLMMQAHIQLLNDTHYAHMLLHMCPCFCSYIMRGCLPRRPCMLHVLLGC